MHIDTQFVAGPLYFNAAYCAVRQSSHKVLTNFPVFGEIFLIFACAEPAALPVGSNTETEAVGIDLLAHQFSSFVSGASVDVLSDSVVAAALAAARCRLRSTRARRAAVAGATPRPAFFACKTARRSSPS